MRFLLNRQVFPAALLGGPPAVPEDATTATLRIIMAGDFRNPADATSFTPAILLDGPPPQASFPMMMY